METFSALLALCAGNSPVTGEFPTQRPVTRSFDAFFDLRLNKRLSKGAFTWRVRACGPRTAGPALRARTESSHINKEGVFTLARADVQARMRRKTRRVSCGNFPHPQAFLWLVHDVKGVRKLSFQQDKPIEWKIFIVWCRYNRCAVLWRYFWYFKVPSIERE